MNFDFSSITGQIISYMKSLFSTFAQSGLSENTVVKTITEYINGVIENFTGAGFDVGELKSSITEAIKIEFADTEFEDMADDATKDLDQPEVPYVFNRNKIPTSIEEHPLFELNGVDYTPYIEAPTWKVNATEIYEEKQNADKKFLRTVIRTRITGTFKLVFDDIPAYEKFISDAWNLKGNCGEVTVNLWVNNMLSYRTGVKIYMTFDGHRYEVPLMGSKNMEGIEVTVEEY